MKKLAVSFLMVGLSLIGGACSQTASSIQVTSSTTSSTMNTNAVLKVSVLASGKVLADGSEVSLTDLDARLAGIKSQNGVVWYYRESAQSTPPPIVAEVLNLVTKYKLPISMSSKPDFSDTVDSKGVSHPR